MNQAVLYRNINDQSRRDIKAILDEYKDFVHWRKDGRDSLFDIGSGTGDVLMDFIFPRMPANFEQLVGSDLTAKMVSYANKCYSSNERTKFEVLDIGTDVLPQHLRGRFDHVTSFYCLHWVQNHKKMLENISALLRDEGGDFFIVFLATQFMYDCYKALSETHKWGKYMQDYKNFTSRYHYSPDPAAEFSRLVEEAGFVDYKVDIRSDVYVYEGLKNIRTFIRAIAPFFDRMPDSLHEEFLDDFVNTMVSFGLREKLDNSSSKEDEYGYVSKYNLIIAYACKPSSLTE